MDLRSIMNNDGPPPLPQKARNLPDVTKAQETSAQHVHTHFLDSPSQTTRQSPFDVSPHSASRTRSEATPSPHTTIPQASTMSPRLDQSNMAELVASPHSYRAPSSYIPSDPHMSKSQPPERSGNGARPGSSSMQASPVNSAAGTTEQSIPSIPKPKRPKIYEKPIWAMKVSEYQKLRLDQRPQPQPQLQQAFEPKAEQTTMAAPVPAPTLAPQPPMLRPLQTHSEGWEPSITNVLPSEELSRKIADFLFQEVITRKDIPLGPNASGKLEIEAKIGQIVNRDTTDRLRLPVLTETILARNDPSLRTTFRSSMTEAQHRHFNQYLNEVVKNTLPKKVAPNGPPATPSNRVRMDYKHTREIDSFYDLTPTAEASLPPIVRSLITSNRGGTSRARVRLTTDQKDGRQLAKIIKVRLADLDVFSPGTPFDWRLSVNLEMDYNQGQESLVEVVEQGKRAPDRNKDRMTYLHQSYQIDLTQVTIAGGVPANGLAPGDKEHELEIEVKVEDLKREGDALMKGEESRYEDMVRGLVDNVRILMRSWRG